MCFYVYDCTGKDEDTVVKTAVLNKGTLMEVNPRFGDEPLRIKETQGVRIQAIQIQTVKIEDRLQL